MFNYIYHAAKQTNIGTFHSRPWVPACGHLRVSEDASGMCSLPDTDRLREVLIAFIIILRFVMSFLCEDGKMTHYECLGYE
jgi:hypothetical protein